MKRTLTIAATAALAGVLLLPGTAHAGGAPDLGVVTVGPVAVLVGSEVTVTGTYACTTTGTGTLGFSVLARGGASTQEVSVPVECDGAVHPWSATAAGADLPAGTATFWGHLEVCDTGGDCPWNLLEERVALVPQR